MKGLIPLLFLLIVFNCSSPLQKDYGKKIVAPKTIYQASQNERITEIAVSPQQEQLALVLETQGLRIYDQETSRFHTLPFFVSDSFYLSKNAQALAYYHKKEVFIKDFSTKHNFQIPLTNQILLGLKWQNDRLALVILTRQNQYYQVAQYRIEGEHLVSQKLLRTQQWAIKSADFNSQKQMLTFIALNSASNATYLYWLRLTDWAIDSIKINTHSTNISIDEEGRRIAWLVNKNSLMVLNLTSRQIQQFNLTTNVNFPPEWQKGKLLLSADSGYVVWDIQNSKNISSLQASVAPDVKSDQVVWAKNEDRIIRVKKIKKNKLIVFNPEVADVDQELEVEGKTISSLSWNESGQKLLYFQNKQVQILDLQVKNNYSLNVPFPHAPLARWGPEKDWISFISNQKQTQKQFLFNLNTGQIKEFTIGVYSTIKDFSWTINSKKVLYSIPDISRLFTFIYTGDDLKYEKAYTLVAEAVRWAPTNTQLNKSIGEYAIFKGQPTLGIYFLKSNNLNWILHLQSKNIIDFDWSSDGRSVYYIYNEQDRAPVVMLEQILYPDEI